MRPAARQKILLDIDSDVRNALTVMKFTLLENDEMTQEELCSAAERKILLAEIEKALESMDLFLKNAL